MRRKEVLQEYSNLSWKIPQKVYQNDRNEIWRPF